MPNFSAFMRSTRFTSSAAHSCFAKLICRLAGPGRHGRVAEEGGAALAGLEALDDRAEVPVPPDAPRRAGANCGWPGVVPY